jgi:hypothetical protein
MNTSIEYSPKAFRRYTNDSMPLVVDPEIAEKIGLNESIIIRQIHYWLLKNEENQKNFYKGKFWCYNSLQEWQKTFTFWSESTIKRTFNSLEKLGLIIITKNPNNGFDKTNWYTIKYDIYAGLFDQVKMTSSIGSKWSDREGQNDPMYNYTETTTETTTESSSRQTFFEKNENSEQGATVPTSKSNGISPTPYQAVHEPKQSTNPNNSIDPLIAKIKETEDWGATSQFWFSILKAVRRKPENDQLDFIGYVLEEKREHTEFMTAKYWDLFFWDDYLSIKAKKTLNSTSIYHQAKCLWRELLASGMEEEKKLKDKAGTNPGDKLMVSFNKDRWIKEHWDTDRAGNISYAQFNEHDQKELARYLAKSKSKSYNNGYN